jgi:hypothetical protein
VTGIVFGEQSCVIKDADIPALGNAERPGNTHRGLE